MIPCKSNSPDTVSKAPNQIYRRDVKEMRKDVALVKEKLTSSGLNEICSWLESTNPSSNHNAAWALREKDTGLWMLGTQEWVDWVNGRTRFLWLHGIPGAGKTVLASFLIHTAQEVCRAQGNSACVYYYCHFSRNQDETAPFLRWVVSQLSRQARLIPKEISELHNFKHLPSVPMLLNALEQILSEFHSVTIILDAVDESMPRDDLLRILRDFVTDHRFDKVRLLATSREYFDIEQCFQKIASAVPMNNPVVGDDIKRYVHNIIRTNWKFHSWSSALAFEVENALTTGAQGM